MYVKLSLENLNLGLYPPHLTNTYNCKVITALRVHGGSNTINILLGVILRYCK